MPVEGPFDQTVRELRQLAEGGGTSPPPIAPGRVGGDDPGMDARVKRLEDDVRAIRSDLTAIIGRLGTVEGKLDTLLTQIVTKVPGSWQMFSIILGTLVAGVTIFGGAIGVARWLRLLPG